MHGIPFGGGALYLGLAIRGVCFVAALAVGVYSTRKAVQWWHAARAWGRMTLGGDL